MVRMMSERTCPSCQVTVLSRYNAEPLCATCVRGVREAGPQTPDWLWDSKAMREALARVDLGAVVVTLRGAAGLSQLDLANLVVGWSQSTVSHIERGTRSTLYDIRELLRFADAVGMPRTALYPLILGTLGGTLEVDKHESVGAGVDLDRRSFGGMTAGLAVAMAASELSTPDRVSASHLLYLRSGTERLYRRDQNMGGAALLHQALRQFACARRMLDESDYTEAVGEQLLVVAGDLAVCSGWLAFDGGDTSLAGRMYNEALMLAGSTSDAVLSAHVLANMSMLSSYIARTTGRKGLARDGLRLAERAADVARHESSPRVQALIALRRATAAGLLGDELAARGAITRARRELDRGPHESDPEWIHVIDETEITGHEAMVSVNLGEPEHGERLYRSVLEDPGVTVRNRAYYGALLAGTLLVSGAGTAAVEEGLAVLPALVGGVTSVRTLNELRPIRAVAGEEFCVRFDVAERVLVA